MTLARPLVSIVIAAYRSDRDHLAVAIDCALAQTWPYIEIIIGDDSPDDGLRVVMARLGDGRLRYRHNQPALGVAGNHWLGFSEAQGEYVAVLNHDDWLAPDFVATLVEALERNPVAVLAFCDHWIIDHTGRRLPNETERNSRVWGRTALAPGLHRPMADLLAAQTIPMAMGCVFRRAALPATLPAGAGPAYDLWLTYLLARTAGGAWYVPERLSAWRSHPSNLTSAAGLPWLRGSADCWQAIAADAQFSGVRAIALSKAAASLRACATRAWRDGQRRDCFGFAWRSLRAGFSVKGLAALLLLPWLPARFAAWQAGITRRGGDA